MGIPNDMKVGTTHETNRCGILKVIDYVDRNNVLVVFIKTGTEVWTRSQNIRIGSVRDLMCPVVFGVGFTGIGSEKTAVNGVDTKAYECWKSMMARCYSDALHKRSPTYAECEVCSDWLNFQNFSKWYKDNYPTDGGKYELDKDIKVKGNKIYSPDACNFVTAKENSAFSNSKSYLFLTPKGKRRVLIRNMKRFCEMVGINASNMLKVSSGKAKSCKGWTVSTLANSN